MLVRLREGRGNPDTHACAWPHDAAVVSLLRIRNLIRSKELLAASTLTRKGQTTIPIKVRNHLKLRPGDKIEFVIQKDGKVVMTPKNIDIRELAGMLGPARRKLTIEQMDEAIRSRFRRR